MKRGFSLIEMLCAVALAATLMVMLLVVTTDVAANAESKRQESESAGVNLLALRALLERDLEGCRTLDVGEGEFVVSGYGGLDGEDMSVQGGPVRITYRLVPEEEPSMLVREQRRPAEISNDSGFVEVVAYGVADMWVSMGAEPDSSGSPVNSLGTFPRPRALHVSLADEEGEPVFEEAICLR